MGDPSGATEACRLLGMSHVQYCSTELRGSFRLSSSVICKFALLCFALPCRAVVEEALTRATQLEVRTIFTTNSIDLPE